FAHGVTVLQNTCPGLVGEIEKGALHSPETHRILEEALLPMLAQGMDRVVMGCTHYPFVIPLIKEIVGDSVKVIDPAPAIARQVERLLKLHDLRFAKGQGEVRVVTTGEVEQLKEVLPLLVGKEWPASGVQL
ncbi:MAG: aspartate/glutamate racemase family protein, partial [Chloroflexota bacterium]|nr:aspartate/glutamate racemase family protein [Chloroflexota bacterium]